MGLFDSLFGNNTDPTGVPDDQKRTLMGLLAQSQLPGLLGFAGQPPAPEGRSVSTAAPTPDGNAMRSMMTDADYAQPQSTTPPPPGTTFDGAGNLRVAPAPQGAPGAPMQLPSAAGTPAPASGSGFDLGKMLGSVYGGGGPGDSAIAFGAGLMSKRGGAGVQAGLDNMQRQALVQQQTALTAQKTAQAQSQLQARDAWMQQKFPQMSQAERLAASGNDSVFQDLFKKANPSEQWVPVTGTDGTAYGLRNTLTGDMKAAPQEKETKQHFFTGADGKQYAVDPNDPTKPATLIQGQATDGGHWATPAELPPGTDTKQPIWVGPNGQPKGISGATSISVDTGTKAREAGMKTAYELDAQAVRKAQNEQLPALDDADHNMSIMRTAIERNGGKLPTGGTLAALGLDFGRTQSYLRDAWGINVGNPDELANLEAFNKGGIRLAGDNAKAVGGNRVLKTEFDLSQRAVPGLETSSFGNVYNLDAMQNTNNIKRDYLQAQEDYWRKNDGSLTGFNQAWKKEIEENPRYLSTYSVAKPVDNGDGSQMMKLPSTVQGGYTWFRKGQDGSFSPVNDKLLVQSLDKQSPLPTQGGAAQGSLGQAGPRRTRSGITYNVGE